MNDKCTPSLCVVHQDEHPHATAPLPNAGLLPEGAPEWVPPSPDGAPAEAACVLLEGLRDASQLSVQHAPALLLWSPDFFEAAAEHGGGTAEAACPCRMVAGPKGAQLVVA